MAYSGNLIPTMTSATAPSGWVTSTNDYGGAGWHAFDHLNTDASYAWLASPPASYLQYQFPAAHTITQYAVTSRNYSTVYAPKTWTFKGSTDGATWTTLDTQTNVTDWANSPNTRKVFALANSTSYDYYRLDITVGNSGTYVCVGELEMMEDAGEAPPAVTYVSRSIGSGIGSGIASGIA